MNRKNKKESDKKKCYSTIKKIRLSMEELQQLKIEIQQVIDYLNAKQEPYYKKIRGLKEQKKVLYESFEQQRKDAWALYTKANNVKAQSVGVFGVLFGNERSRQRDLQVNELNNRSSEIYRKNEERWFTEKNRIEQERDIAWKKVESFTWNQADVSLLKKEIIIDGYSKKLGDVLSIFLYLPPPEFTVSAIEQLIKELKKKHELDHLKARAASTSKEARQAAVTIKKQIANQFKVLKICPYCGHSFNISSAHADHIYPISKGGYSTINNMVYVCEDCNIKKSNNTLNQFIRKTGYDRQDIERCLELLNKDY